MSKRQRISSTNEHPFRRAVLRGLGVVLPPLLTVVFLLWIWNSVQSFVLTPIKDMVRSVAVSRRWDVVNHVPPNAQMLSLYYNMDDKLVWRTTRESNSIDLENGTLRRQELRAFRLPGEETIYCELASREWIPFKVYYRVRKNPGPELPETAEAFYRRDVEAQWFRPSVIFPITLSVFILVLYLLGKIIAASIGRALMNFVERLIDRVPFIGTVYSTVKKVTDMVFADRELEFNRVVAVEYPRSGLWSIGFVTGASLPVLRQSAGESMLSVLMPTSPMPATGFTISVRKSEAIELDITVDQAVQFIVSCGFVVPGVSSGDAQAITDAIENRVDRAADSTSSSSPTVSS